MMLASASPDGGFVWQLLLAVSFLGNLGLVLMNLANRRQKRDVRFETEYAPKDELRQIKESLARLDRDGEERRRNIYEKMDSLRIEWEGKIADVHERINDVLEAVGEVRGELKNRRH